MKMLKKITAAGLLLTFILSFTGINQIVSFADTDDILSVSNDFIRFTVDKSTGRFGISTVEGAPGREADQDSPLLFSGEKPESSFTTFRIDGSDYIFGNDYGFLGTGGGITGTPETSGNINTTVWKIGDIEVSQQLCIVSDKNNPDAGNVKVTYTVSNKGKTGKSVGSRILFDTMLGKNDGSPLIVPGREGSVEYETSFEGDEVPDFWQAADNDAGPEIVSYGLLGGWGNKKPDMMTAAHWSGISATKWDYRADSSLKFTSEFNKYNANDSAVALYWNPANLLPGETRTFETFYGLGLFASADGSTFLADLEGPDSLQLNDGRTGYIEDEFEISLSISNNLPVSVAMSGVTATIEVDNGIVLSGNETKQKTAGIIERDSESIFKWKLKGILTNQYRLAQATVYLRSDSFKQPLVYSKYIILPGSSGTIPDIQYTGITPGKLYYKDSRKSFDINGTGFELLRDRSNWNLKLSKSGPDPVVYNIDHSLISIKNNTTINVALPEFENKGTYTVIIEHDSLLGCKLENALELTDDTSYEDRTYGILAVTGSNNSYSLKGLESEAELGRFSGSNNVLLIIRGDVRKKENRFEVYSGSNGKSVEINDVLLYNSDRPLIISGTDGSVDIEGDGDLSVEGSIVFWKWSFFINMDKGKSYSLTQSGENAGDKIEIQFPITQGSLLNMLSGFKLQFNNAYLYKDKDGYGMIFGGSLYLALGKSGSEGGDNSGSGSGSGSGNGSGSGSGSGSNSGSGNSGSGSPGGEDPGPFTIEANVDKVAIGQKSNGEVGLKGIAADATVGFPKDFFPPPVDIGAEASLRVDTFSDPGEVGMNLDVDLKVIKVRGELEFKLIPYPIPNKLYFFLGSDVGVDIIPPVPVATLYGVGGGIDNLYSLIDWDMMYSAPLTVMITASAEVARILKMEDVTLSISWQQVEITGDIGIKGYDIIKGATLRLRWYNPFGFSLSARLEAFGCIRGEVMLQIMQNDFLGTASVEVYVPEEVKIIGGLTLAGLGVGVDTEKVWGELKIIGITLGIKYIYGESMPDFYLASLEQGIPSGLKYPEGLCTVSYSDGETGQKGTMVYGTNINLVGSSTQRKKYQDSEGKILAAAGNDLSGLSLSTPVVTALNDGNYTLNVTSSEAALFELDYEGVRPNIRIYRPDGTEYPLIADDLTGNMRYQTIDAEHSKSGKTEQKIWISVIGPELGTWKIVSDKPLISASLYDVKMGPEFTSVKSTKTDPYSVRVDWTGNYLNGALVNLFLVEEGSSEAGRLLAENINAAAGSYTVSIPDDVPTGRYAIRAEVKKADYGYKTTTTEAFDITDLKAPAPPSGLRVEPAGNGMFRVSWGEGTGSNYPAKGYVVTVLNGDGTPVAGFPEAYVEGRTETLIGGGVTQTDGTVTKLEPGKEYRISVAAHREDEPAEGEQVKKQHFSLPVISGKILLPVPAPPALNVSVKQGDKLVPINTGVDNIGEYLATDSNVTLLLGADSTIDAGILVNDSTAYSRSGSSRYEFGLSLNEGENKIGIKGYNSMGDRTEKVIRIMVDTRPPLLLLDSAGTRSSGGITYVDLKGKSEKGCMLSINGGSVAIGEDGLFEYTLAMGDEMKLDILAEAADASGNTTEYRTTVYNNRLKDIRKVEITAGSPRVQVGDSVKLSLYAFDSEGNRLAVDPGLVKWSLMKDTGTAALGSGGALKALKSGKAFVMAEFGVTEGFTHTDAIALNIEEKTAEQGSRISIPDIIARCPEDILKIITAMEQNMTDIFTGRIQPNGPAVVNADGLLSLSIPAGALPSAADILIRRVTDTGGLMGWFPGLRLLSPVYDIKLANGIKPVLPVTVNFRLGAGYTADNGNIAFYRLNEETGAWEYIGGSIDINGIISVRLSGFSKYAVIENSNLRLFKDIAPGRWSKDPIYSLTYLKIAEGEEQRGTYCFYPERNITRAEFIKMLCASLGLDKLDTNDVKLPFSDVARIPGWAAGYIRPAYKYGLVEGRTDNGLVLADADKNITREEACAILGRTLDNPARPGRAYFSDRSSISEYALNYIDALADMGVVNGNTDNTFRPGSLLTREEAAAVIDRYLKARQARK